MSQTTFHECIFIKQPGHFHYMREDIFQAQQSSEHTDIRLVSQDGVELPVHHCLLPSMTIAALTEEVWCCEQPRLVLAQETSTSVRCLVTLLYSGPCSLQGTTVLELNQFFAY